MGTCVLGVMPQTYGFEIESFGLTPAQIKNAIESVEGQVYQSPTQTFGTGSDNSNGRIYGYMESKRIPLRCKENNTGNLWIAAEDSSIYAPNGMLDHEVISPVLEGQQGLETVKRVMKALKKAGAKTNKSCGLHVTMGVANCSARWSRMAAKKKASCMVNLADAYIYFMDYGFSELCSSSRSPRSSNASNYASYPSTNWDSMFGTATKQDFVHAGIRPMFTLGRGALNFNNLWSSGVVEFRQHNGTLDGNKIVNWALLCHKLLSTSINDEHIHNRVDVRNFTPNLEGLLEYVNAGSDLQTALFARQDEVRSSQYYMKRWDNGSDHFNTEDAYNCYQNARSQHTDEDPSTISLLTSECQGGFLTELF